MSSPSLKKFGQQVRHLRNGLGLTQESLADKCGLHPTYIGGVERGERNIGLENIIKISRALNSSPSRIFSAFDEESDE